MTADDIRHVADGVQWLALVTAVLLLLMVLAAGWHWPGWRKALAFPVIYGALATVFYVAALANAIPSPLISLLSSLLRLYSHVLMLATLGVVVIVTMAGGHAAAVDAENSDEGADDGA